MSRIVQLQITLPIERKYEIPTEQSSMYTTLFPDKNTSPVYCHRNGLLFAADSIEWLQQVESCSVDLVFADPPYNIKKADWDKFESQEQYIAWSLLWIKEAARILKPTGSLYICGFSEILADLKHPSMRYFKGCKWLVWNYRNKANWSARGGNYGSQLPPAKANGLMCD